MDLNPLDQIPQTKCYDKPADYHTKLFPIFKYKPEETQMDCVKKKKKKFIYLQFKKKQKCKKI